MDGDFYKFLYGQVVIDELKKRNAHDIRIFNVEKKIGIASFIVVVSGKSQKNVKALLKYVVKKLKTENLYNYTVHGVENSDWIVLDTGDIIFNIMPPEVREYYDIDSLWAESGEVVNF